MENIPMKIDLGCEHPKPKRKKKKVIRKKPSPFRSGRVRSRSEMLSEDYLLIHLQTTDPNGAPLPMPWPYVDVERISTTETIVDTTGNLASIWNPVDHWKYDGSGITRPGVMFDASGSPAMSTAHLPNYIENVIPTYAPGPSPGDLNRISNQMEDHFRSAVKPEVLLYNFIAELIAMCEGNIEKANKAAAKFTKIVQNFKKMYLKLLAEGKPDAWFLAWQFCIAPNIKDFHNIVCSFSNAKKRLEWLIRNNGKVVLVEWRSQHCFDLNEADLKFSLGRVGSYHIGAWNPENPPWNGGPVSPMEDSPDEYIVDITEYELECVGRAQVVFRIPEYKLRDGGAFLVWESMMGLDRPFAAFWEAIPFSFVVDWFTGVAKDLATWLDNSVTAAWPQGEILNCGHSFKLKTKSNLLVHHWFDGSTDDNLGSFTYTRYIRQRGLPRGKPSMFSEAHDVPMRAALGSALVTQKLRTIIKRSRRR